jgi:two-component system sensor histidine kinase RpfC
MLDLGGYQVELAEDGEQALEMLENKRYDLMILDLNMPVFGGLDVMKIHNASVRQSPRTPVAILTANATVEAIRECEEAGVDAYLVKPVEAVNLLDTVARLTATVGKSEPAEAENTALSVVGIDEVPLIDEQTLQRLAALGKGDVNFLQTVVHGYIAETEKLLDAMRTALGKQEATTFKELAHTLKGSSGNVGALALHQLSRKMMQLDRAQFDQCAGELLSQANGSLKSTKMMLFRYLNESDRASL